MAEKTAADYTRKEAIVTFISREMKNDDSVSFPAGIPEIRAGVFLANFTPAPDLKIYMTMSWVNVLKEDKLEPFNSAMDWRFSRSPMPMSEEFLWRNVITFRLLDGALGGLTLVSNLGFLEEVLNMSSHLFA